MSRRQTPGCKEMSRVLLWRGRNGKATGFVAPPIDIHFTLIHSLPRSPRAMHVENQQSRMWNLVAQPQGNFSFSFCLVIWWLRERANFAAFRLSNLKQYWHFCTGRRRDPAIKFLLVWYARKKASKVVEWITLYLESTTSLMLLFSQVSPAAVLSRQRKKSGIKILGVAEGVGHRKERERGAVGTKTMQHKNVPEINNINDDFISKLSCFLLFAAMEYSTCKHW